MNAKNAFPLTLLLMGAACGAETAQPINAPPAAAHGPALEAATNQAVAGPCQPGYAPEANTGTCLPDIAAQLFSLATSKTYRNVAGQTVTVHDPNNLFYVFHLAVTNKSPVLVHMQFTWYYGFQNMVPALQDAQGGIPNDMPPGAAVDGIVVIELLDDASAFEAALTMTSVSTPRFSGQGWDIGSVQRIPWCSNNPCKP
jgi:hypothetical protein